MKLYQIAQELLPFGDAVPAAESYVAAEFFLQEDETKYKISVDWDHQEVKMIDLNYHCFINNQHDMQSVLLALYKQVFNTSPISPT